MTVENALCTVCVFVHVLYIHDDTHYEELYCNRQGLEWSGEIEHIIEEKRERITCVAGTAPRRPKAEQQPLTELFIEQCRASHTPQERLISRARTTSGKMKRSGASPMLFHHYNWIVINRTNLIFGVSQDSKIEPQTFIIIINVRL